MAEADLLETDLFLIPRTPATLTGLREEFIAASRLDDLQCAFACLHGLLRSAGSTLSGEGEMVPVLALFNHEEVGSGTWQGADSTFLPDLLRTICRRYDRVFSAAAAASFLVSADNAHAVHPAHPEYADRTEFPVLGGGVVLKYNANQRYTTDAISAAVFAELCRRAGVPVQRYSNRADLPGGSTLGHIATAQVSVRSVDIGLPQLAMHSAWELAAVGDTEDLIRAMDAYFSCDLRVTPEGITL